MAVIEITTIIHQDRQAPRW